MLLHYSTYDLGCGLAIFYFDSGILQHSMIVNNDSSVVVIRKLPTLRLVEIDNRPVSQQQKDFMPNERAIPGTNLISNIQY